MPAVPYGSTLTSLPDRKVHGRCLLAAMHQDPIPVRPDHEAYRCGAVTLTSTLVLLPPNRPPRHANTAAMTTIRKITRTATTPALPPPSLSPIVSTPP